MLRVLVLGLVLLVAVMTLLPRTVAPPEVATILPESLALPEFRLVDDSGLPLDLDALRGHFSLLFFGFTNCPDVCPLTLQVLAETRADIRELAGPVPSVVFVSVDPHRDTPERIRAYLDNFDPEFAGATGDDTALAPLLAALGVSVETHEHGGENYNVVHSSAIYIVGPRARLIAVSSAPHTAATLAADYVKIRKSYEASQPEATS